MVCHIEQSEISKKLPLNETLDFSVGKLLRNDKANNS